MWSLEQGVGWCATWNVALVAHRMRACMCSVLRAGAQGACVHVFWKWIMNMVLI